MIADAKRAEMRKLFSADTPTVNWAREEIEERISDLLDLSGIDMSESTSSVEIGLQARARKLAAQTLREIFVDLGFDFGSEPNQDRKKSFR
jgi:hypothetical protein